MRQADGRQGRKMKKEARKIKLKSNSAKETVEFGKLFSKVIRGGDVILLEGALGGGKTTFIKGTLSGLGYKRRVLSPSFTLLRQYGLKKTSVHHLDLYRLEPCDIFDLGIDEFIYSRKAITLIEWGDKIKGSLDRYIKIEFMFRGESVRNIKFTTKGYPDKTLTGLREVYKKYA